ncbi:MAG: secretin N-terminal domain-containing protein [Capsulimonas sp.]|uniref:secretin N-terminal domain-containing protein n=1 Tax=Capsulimonas sp. TaxID=2494211 RepID=UPI0032639A02
MRTKQSIVMLAALAACGIPAHAQFDRGGGGGQTQTPAPPPWKSFNLNPNTRVTLDFRNTNVDAVLHILSKASGVTIVKDPSLTGGITVQSPTKQSLGSAFAILNATLGLKNYEIVKQDNFLLVKPKSQRGGGFGGFGGFGGSQGGQTGGFGGFGGGGRGGSSLVMRVYPIKYASATQLARAINDVFANAAAAAAVDAANNGVTIPGVGTFPGAAQGGFGGGRGGGRGGRGGGAAATPAVKVSADEYSNSIIVNASSRDQDQVADIIDQIDKPTASPRQTKVFKLQYAVATDVATVLQGVISNSTTLGRGSSTTNNNQRGGNQGGGGFGGRFGQFFGGGQSTQNTANGTVVAETRTNSVVVTATPENMAVVTQLITQIDKPVDYVGTTFVYMLKNARADVVANLLNQSFGRSGSSSSTANGGSLTGQTASTNTSTTGISQLGGNNNNTNRNNNQNNNTSRNASASTTSITTGLDSQGRVVNVRDLNNQVLLIPNIDTNSVIVVTAPENRTLVESILNQLDEIPEQVMIETLVVEANLDSSNALGVEWNFAKGAPFGIKGATATGSQSFGVNANTAQPQGFRYTLTAADYSVFVQAVKSDTRFDVLSTPRIFTTNNAQAQINISQSIPYVTSQTTDLNNGTISNYSFLDVGIVLTVTPRITSNGYVTMDVTQTANDLVSYTSFNAPIVNQREAQTTASVKDGETIVLGGIMNTSFGSTVSKVPILGDIPLIGNLFKSTSRTKKKTELLVFLTPHVVRDPEEARRLREQTVQGIDPAVRGRLPAALLGSTTSLSNVQPVNPAPVAPPIVNPTPPVTGDPPAAGPIKTTVTITPPAGAAAPAITAPAAPAPAPNMDGGAAPTEAPATDGGAPVDAPPPPAGGDAGGGSEE